MGKELDFTARLLSKEQIEIQPSYDGIHIIASFFECPIGFRQYEKYFLSDFPNSLAGQIDFERCRVDITNGKPIGGN